MYKYSYTCKYISGIRKIIIVSSTYKYLLLLYNYSYPNMNINIIIRVLV